MGQTTVYKTCLSLLQDPNAVPRGDQAVWQTLDGFIYDENSAGDYGLEVITAGGAVLIPRNMGQGFHVDQWGAIPDATKTVSCHAQLQAAVDRARRENSTLFLGTGTYWIGSNQLRLDNEINGAELETNDRCSIMGQGLSTIIRGDVPNDALVSRDPGSEGSAGGIRIFRMERLYILNESDTVGSWGMKWGKYVSMATIANCRISGHNGLWLHDGASEHGMNLDSCKFGASIREGTGLLIYSNQTNVFNCESTGCYRGMVISRGGINIIGGRLEVNVYGLIVGADEDAADVVGEPGSNASWSSSVTGLTFESNYYNCLVRAGGASVHLHGLRVYGGSNGPDYDFDTGEWISGNLDDDQVQGTPEYGFKLNGSATLSGCLSYGKFKRASCVVDTGGCSFTNCEMSALTNNGFSGTGWEVNAPLSELTFVNSNYELSGHGLLTTGPLLGTGLSAFDFSNPAKPIPKNFGDSNVTVPALASTLDVVFPIEARRDNANITSYNAVAGGSLPDGDVFYHSALISMVGLTALNTSSKERILTMGSGNNTADLTFNTHDHPKHRFRLYRGTESGKYDGWWDLPYGERNFIDDGTIPFDVGMWGEIEGVKQAGIGRDAVIAGRPEDDANYSVLVSPSWNAGNIWISPKSTLGFTINFENAPAANATLGWLLFR